MPKIVTAAQMKKLDRITEERYGIPGVVLMENAGRESANEILKRFKKGKAAIFCGKGNNGGDGFVCGRYLMRSGIKTHFFLLGSSRDLKSADSLINLNILKKMDAKIKELVSAEDFDKVKRSFHYDFIVDAMFGIGFKGALPCELANLVSFLNEKRRPTYALDVPSGLDATTGALHGACIKAYKTITFGLLKTGLQKKSRKPYTGRVVIKDIGLVK